jgi:hypothetical protein
MPTKRQLRRIRAWLVEHPGATAAQIQNIFHVAAKALAVARVAYWYVDAERLIRWHVRTKA